MKYIEGLIENDGVKIFYRDYGLKESADPFGARSRCSAGSLASPPYKLSCGSWIQSYYI